MHWNSNSVILYKPKNDIFYCHTEDKAANKKFYQKLEDILAKDGNNVFTIHDDMPSIWVRDYFPTNVDGKFIQFTPCLTYMNEEQKVFYESFDFDSLQDFFTHKNFKRYDLVLDGGNVVFNDEYIITTEKVFKDNKPKSKKEVERIIREAFNDRKVIFLETEDSEYDPVGHSDGIVNFLDNETLLMADYRKIDQELHKHNHKLLKNKFNVVILPQYFVDTISSIDEAHAWYDIEGCYVNFIGTKNSLVFSKFKYEEYNEKVKELIKKHDKLNRKLHFIDTSHVTKYGGGLHCISCDYADNGKKTPKEKHRHMHNKRK